MFFNKIKTFVTVVGTTILFYSTCAAAAAQDLGAIASSVTSSMQSVGSLLGAGSYVAGFGMTIAALFKFKQHKDNPTQMPLGTPIALLVIGIALVFLPSVISTGGATIFAGSGSMTGFSGSGISNIK